ncbi:conserved protein of unknown function [Tenacibaculum sp. 190130A14a]|uniref:Uncharacterized protein n=1 Tax=Tenacibaculum polynesiense TaxID=3137857 RepID=A0ABM9PC23_9FLAO
MKRVIVEYSKLTTNILDLLVAKYPDGYEYEDIISFQNSQGQTTKAVEVKTEDTIYLVKINKQLNQTIEDYSEDRESFNDFDNEYF